jgi:Domain of unknown function (DUF4124)
MAFNKNNLVCVSLATVALLSLSHSACAQLYKWTDENGKVHYSDSVPPSANDRARKEIRSDGIVKGQIDRALTPEERRAAAQKAAEDEKVRIAKEERERREKALLTSYSSVEEYDRVRARDLAQIQSENNALGNQIYVLQTQLTELSKTGDPKSARAKAAAEQERDELKKRINDLSRERDASIKRLLDTTERFRVERERFVRLLAEQAEANKLNAPAPNAAKKKS